MSMAKLLLAASGLIMAVLVVAGYAGARGARASCQFEPHSLIGASSDEVAKAAISYACATMTMLTDTPLVRLSRPIAPTEVITLFGRNDTLCQDQALALVILQGDFDVSNIFPSANQSRRQRAAFVGYVFDLRAGLPTMTITSNGERFRKALNDPTLPSDGPVWTPEPGITSVPAPSLPPVDHLRACSFGATAPTVAPH